MIRDPQLMTKRPAAELHTERLRLRNWNDDDFPVFAQMNDDDEVMAYFPEKLSAAESEEAAKSFRAMIALNGWGLWAVDEKASDEFIGFVGLKPVVNIPYCATNNTPRPSVEIAWRLRRTSWGRGFAQEAARECLRLGFEELKLPEIISFATVTNKRSQRVMQAIGMRDLQQNFNHPQVPADSGLQEHVLYRIDRADYLSVANQNR
jgi:RimJ/RimL family protein N-acetyltransferase